MVIIYETENFIAESIDNNPHITRTDGGHIKIYPKVRYVERQDLTPKLAIEMMKITNLVGEAMKSAMSKRGIDIGRINYQDNGNWSVFKPEGPYLHIHLYGRAKDAKYQPYGQACVFPHIKEKPEFYSRNKPLNADDVSQIKEEIKKLLESEKYSDKEWGLLKS